MNERMLDSVKLCALIRSIRSRYGEDLAWALIKDCVEQQMDESREAEDLTDRINQAIKQLKR